MTAKTMLRKTKDASITKLKKEKAFIKKENLRLKKENSLIKSREFDFRLTANEIYALRELAAIKLLEVENEISDNDIDLKIPTTMSIYISDKKAFYEKLFSKLNFDE